MTVAMADKNRMPEQQARDNIDLMSEQAGWKVQSKKKIDFNAGFGIAVREYQTDVGPADYVLFIDKKPVGVVEAKPEDWGQKITTVEKQSAGYAAAKLKWVNKKEPLPFVYESTGVLTRFADTRDPRPRSREIFNFPRPETTQEWHTQPASLRARLQELPVLGRHGTESLPRPRGKPRTGGLVGSDPTPRVRDEVPMRLAFARTSAHADRLRKEADRLGIAPAVLARATLERQLVRNTSGRSGLLRGNLESRIFVDFGTHANESDAGRAARLYSGEGVVHHLTWSDVFPWCLTMFM